MSRRSRSLRNSFFRDESRQGGLILRCSMHWLVFSLATVVIAGLLSYCMDPFQTAEGLANTAIRTCAPTFLALAALLPVFVYDYVKLSNRIFGPVRRIQGLVKTLAEGGDAERINLRKGDSHTELASDMNTLLDSINELRGEVRGLAEPPPRFVEGLEAGEEEMVGKS